MCLTGQPERINIRMIIVVTNELNFLSMMLEYLIVHPFQLWPASRTVVFLRRAWCTAAFRYVFD